MKWIDPYGLANVDPNEMCCSVGGGSGAPYPSVNIPGRGPPGPFPLPVDMLPIPDAFFDYTREFNDLSKQLMDQNILDRQREEQRLQEEEKLRQEILDILYPPQPDYGPGESDIDDWYGLCT